MQIQFVTRSEKHLLPINNTNQSVLYREISHM